jgi:hypothetical protein
MYFGNLIVGVGSTTFASGEAEIVERYYVRSTNTQQSQRPLVQIMRKLPEEGGFRKMPLVCGWSCTWYGGV